MPYADPDKRKEAWRESKRRSRQKLYGDARGKERNCGWCNTLFEPKRYFRGRHAYCCDVCRASASQERAKQARNAKVEVVQEGLIECLGSEF